MIGTDLIGLGALISSTLAGIAGIIVAWRQTGTRNTLNAVHRQTETSNGRTLGQMVEASDKRDIAADARPATS